MYGVAPFSNFDPAPLFHATYGGTFTFRFVAQVGNNLYSRRYHISACYSSFCNRVRVKKQPLQSSKELIRIKVIIRPRWKRSHSRYDHKQYISSFLGQCECVVIVIVIYKFSKMEISYFNSLQLDGGGRILMQIIPTISRNHSTSLHESTSYRYVIRVETGDFLPSIYKRRDLQRHFHPSHQTLAYLSMPGKHHLIKQFKISRHLAHKYGSGSTISPTSLPSERPPLPLPACHNWLFLRVALDLLHRNVFALLDHFLAGLRGTWTDSLYRQPVHGDFVDLFDWFEYSQRF